MTLYIDTAATGMWLWDKHKSHPLQPHLLRLAWATDEAGSERCLIVRPLTRWVEEDALALHGITVEAAQALATPLDHALNELRAAVVGQDKVVGYSWDFHRRVIERTALLPEFVWPAAVCAMRAAAPVVRWRLQKNKMWAWPSTQVAFKHFTGEDLVRHTDPIVAGLNQIEALRTIYARITATDRKMA